MVPIYAARFLNNIRVLLEKNWVKEHFENYLSHLSDARSFSLKDKKCLKWTIKKISRAQKADDISEIATIPMNFIALCFSVIILKLLTYASEK